MYIMMNEAMEVTERGGKQSKIDTGFHLGFPARGALIVARVIKEGEPSHGVTN
jgi:hypothetical protein